MIYEFFTLNRLSGLLLVYGVIFYLHIIHDDRLKSGMDSEEAHLPPSPTACMSSDVTTVTYHPQNGDTKTVNFVSTFMFLTLPQGQVNHNHKFQLLPPVNFLCGWNPEYSENLTCESFPNEHWASGNIGRP